MENVLVREKYFLRMSRFQTFHEDIRVHCFSIKGFTEKGEHEGQGNF